MSFDIDRRIGGQWAISRVLAVHPDGNMTALAVDPSGDRSSPLVACYFERCGVLLPKQKRRPNHFQKGELSEPNAHLKGEAA
jgi:hypothetical protein